MDKFVLLDDLGKLLYEQFDKAEVELNNSTAYDEEEYWRGFLDAIEEVATDLDLGPLYLYKEASE